MTEHLPEMVAKMDFVDDGTCFACGKDNPDGMQLQFELLPDGKLRTEYIPPKKFQGFRGILHGGIMAVLMDETMIHLAFRRGQKVATARIEMRFRKPAKIGEKIIVTSEVLWDAGRKMELAAEAKTPDGTLLADGKATMIRI